MNKRELIKLVSEKLGAAKNEVKIAFNIFLQKVAEQTEVDSALRIPEIGIFHLKKKENGLNDQYNLLFLPLKYNPQEKSKILSFDVTVSKEAELAGGEAAFNISIGKPLIPIIGVNRRDFIVQSSYIMLQKTFEEKTETLLSKAVQLTDLKIDTRLIETDDEIINSFLDDYGAYEQISEEAPEVPWDFGLAAEEALTHQDTESTPAEAEKREDDIEIEIPLDEIPDFKSTNAAAEDYKLTEEEPVSQGKDDIIKETFSDEDIFAVQESSLEEENPEFDGSSAETENTGETEITLTEENIISEQEFQDLLSQDSVSDEENNNLISDESIIGQDENKDLITEETDFEKEIPIEEFLTEHDQSVIPQDYNNSGLEEFRITEEDLGLAENEVNNFKETPDEPEQDIEYNIPDEEPESFYSRMQIVTPFETGKDYVRDEEVRPNFKVRYGLWFWVILTSFIVVTLGGIYYFLFYKSDGSNNNLSEKPAEQNIIRRDYDVPVSIIPKSDSGGTELKNEEQQKKENTDEENKADENKPAENKRNENKQETSTVPVTTSSDNKNTLVKEYIFSDGSKFTLQISSWRTKSVAENEAVRLKQSGYPSYLSEYISRDGQKWYRVRVGEFSSLAQAEEFLGKNVNNLFK